MESPAPVRAEKLVYTMSELCAELGVTRETIYKLEKRKFLRAVPGIARNKVFAAAEVRRFIAGGGPRK